VTGKRARKRMGEVEVGAGEDKETKRAHDTGREEPKPSRVPTSPTSYARRRRSVPESAPPTRIGNGNGKAGMGGSQRIRDAWGAGRISTNKSVSKENKGTV
jgi:hypothetical protein